MCGECVRESEHATIGSIVKHTHIETRQTEKKAVCVCVCVRVFSVPRNMPGAVQGRGTEWQHSAREIPVSC